jgi:hypothetical protein
MVGVAPLGFLVAAGVIILTPGPDMTLVAATRSPTDVAPGC